MQFKKYNLELDKASKYHVLINVCILIKGAIDKETFVQLSLQVKLLLCMFIVQWLLKEFSLNSSDYYFFNLN